MKKTIALLCGRGGSTSVKDKNLYPILGRPLMAYPILAAKSSQLVDAIFLSTDSDKMKTVALEHGVSVIDRPAEFATAQAQHVDTLLHALAELKRQEVEVEYLAVVMCNCATYPSGIIDRCIARLKADPAADSCVTGYIENDHHPYRVKRMGSDGYLANWLDLRNTVVSTNRQDLPPCYILDHALWVLRVETCFPPSGQKPWTFMGEKILFEENVESRDVHCMEDLAYTETYLLDRGWRRAEDSEASVGSVKESAVLS